MTCQAIPFAFKRGGQGVGEIWSSGLDGKQDGKEQGKPGFLIHGGFAVACECGACPWQKIQCVLAFVLEWGVFSLLSIFFDIGGAECPLLHFCLVGGTAVRWEGRILAPASEVARGWYRLRRHEIDGPSTSPILLSENLQKYLLFSSSDISLVP